MENILVKIFSSQGPWAALFVFLLLYVLHEQGKRDEKSETREAKYQEIIANLTEKFEDIKDDVREIKGRIFK